MRWLRDIFPGVRQILPSSQGGDRCSPGGGRSCQLDIVPGCAEVLSASADITAGHVGRCELDGGHPSSVIGGAISIRWGMLGFDCLIASWADGEAHVAVQEAAPCGRPKCPTQHGVRIFPAKRALGLILPNPAVMASQGGAKGVCNGVASSFS